MIASATKGKQSRDCGQSLRNRETTGLHGEESGKNEVGANEQGSFDCAFPRWGARMLRSK
jgi:hypothetical protein